jgi:chromosome segregation ATPase
MTKLQAKLTEAEAALAAAVEESKKLNAEYSQITEKLNGRGGRDFDALVETKKRQQQLPELIFTARVNTGKADIAVMTLRREIALEAHREAVRQRQEREPGLDAEIAEAEKKVTDLKIQRNSLLDAINRADREQATYNTRIHDAEAALLEYIQRASFNPDSFKPDNQSNVVRMRPVEIVGDVDRAA